MVCYNCFHEKSSYGPCPLCGYNPAGDAEKFPLALKPGSILNGRYTVGRVLGQGGFGITYIAQDYTSKERVAIKEFLPAEFAGRAQSNAVLPHSGNARENFDYGKQQFLSEAETLAAFNGDEHIVRIYSYFEENNTAYFVMEYVDGSALDKYMAQKGGRLSPDETCRLLLPLMNSLGAVHKKGIIHRDIAPDNIIVTRDGKAKLIDFGAARYSTGEKSKSLDVVLKHGFAPKEQYLRRGRQGPYTDVYALAATWYYAITGKVPPESIERMDEDNLIPPSALGVRIPAEAEDVLYQALEVNAQDRYQSMEKFHTAMAAAYSETGGAAPPVGRGRKPEAQPIPASNTTNILFSQTGLSPREEAELLEKRAREIRAEAERQEREEREARELAEKRERERKEREAKEAEERRKKELAEKKAREEAKRQEKLRLERERREEEKRLAAEKKKQEAADKERLRQETVAKRKAEQEQQRLKAERQKQEREEQKRIASEKKKQIGSEKKASSRKKPVIAIIAALLVAAVAVGYFISSGTKKPAEETPQPQETVQPAPTAEQAKPTAEPPEQLEPAQQNEPVEQTEVQTEPAEKIEEQTEPVEEKTEQSEQVEEQTQQTEQTEQIEATEPVKTPEDYYNEGVALQADGEWDAAIAAFTEAGDYEDAAKKIQEIQNSLRFQEASDLLDAGQYREALSAFEELKATDFKDSAEKSEEIKHLLEYRALVWSDPQAGDTIYYGSYEQDNDPENGKENIEWIVLDREDDRMLVVSKYAVDCQPYNKYQQQVTWRTCTLRNWLNNDFRSNAFTAEERKNIPAMTIGTGSNSRNMDETQDYVFLLSVQEARAYFDSDEARQCLPTDYAREQGCFEDEKTGTTMWWLRAQGNHNTGETTYIFVNAAVRNDGYTLWDGYRVVHDSVAVRPAMWINTSELSKQYQQEAVFHASIQTVGDTVFFGHYEQDNDLANGKDPIEWIVLDVQDGKSLLVSKYVLDRKHPGKGTWKGSALRGWLNTSFKATAFDPSEQNLLVMTETDPEDETEDQVFLLSTGEVSKYRVNTCQPTAFAIKSGVYANENTGNCQWWLRTYSTNTEALSYVNTSGGFMAGEKVSGDHFGVRPAIWLSWE